MSALIAAWAAWYGLTEVQEPLAAATGSGVPGAFPALAGDPVVTARDPKEQVEAVLHGKAIRGISYASQMPAFSQLSDNDIAAIIDRERTAWGNSAPILSPDDVKRARGPSAH